MLRAVNVKYWELCHSTEALGVHKDCDYNARCDMCGDSKTRKNLKRLHLYTKSSYEGDSVKCHNCGESYNMYGYLKAYHPDLYQAYVQETRKSSLDALAFENIEVVTKKNTLYTFNKPSEFTPPNKVVIEYLYGRGFTKEMIQDKVYNGLKIYHSNGLVKLNDKLVNLTNYIIIPLIENDKWYGFYSRSIDKKVFYTFLPEQNTGYKVWNWFNVNKKDTVYIFEAIFNALSVSLPSIACLGSDIDSERLNELSKPVFCFDNDDTGVKKSLKYAELGYSVVVYPKDMLEKDINDLLKAGWGVEQIDNFITTNVYQGTSAVTRLRLKL